jgi:anti-sigma-K factor RskA
LTDVHPRLDIAGYALGTLEPDELLHVEQHLGGCSSCWAEARRLGLVVNNLGLIPWTIPAPALAKVRLLASIDRAPAPISVRTGLSAWKVATAVMAIAASVFALVAGASLFVTRQALNEVEQVNAELGQLRRQVNEQGTALQLLSSANSKLAVLAGSPDVPAAGARIVFDPTGHRALVGVSNFPVIDPDKVFQLWLWRGTERISCALFSVDQAGTQTVSVWAKEELSTYEGMGVTVEPQGGSPIPTGQRVVGGRF